MKSTGKFDRNRMLQQLKETKSWDMIVIGGGATGLGIALDAASRGYSTLLLEQSDFAKGTSSRSTKLVHGGVRYLAQGNVRLVYEALRERGVLMKNACHIVRRQSFIVPCYGWLSKIKYLVGLKVYDLLSGSFSFGKSVILNKKQVLQKLPTMNKKGLVGGVEYFDGQFDDARLAVNLAQTGVEQGATTLNYFKVTALLKEGGRVKGVQVTDMESHIGYELTAKAVINATGVFVDDILQMDMPERKPLVSPSQGVHVVFDRSFFYGDSALMIPKTADGRVLFAVPWHGHVVAGTTDTPLDQHSLEPVALEKEVEFILNTLKQYSNAAPEKKDVLSIFAGLRPLAAPQKKTGSTKEISRNHKLVVTESGLVTITGGKWTTYRKMAEDTVNKAAEAAMLFPAACSTKEINIHGCSSESRLSVNGTNELNLNSFYKKGDDQGAAGNHLSVYGTDEQKIKELINENPDLNKKLAEGLPYTEAEVIWAVRSEMARTVEDVLARRVRILFLDARAAIRAAPAVASLMAREMGYDKQWEKDQLNDFISIANHYLPETNMATK